MASKPKTYAAEHRGRRVRVTVPESELVDKEDACRGCGERDMDRLVWQGTDGKAIRCAACGKVYAPLKPSGA